MNATLTNRRVLLAASDQERPTLRRLLDCCPWKTWDITEADTFEQTRFLVQMDACDVVLLDSSLMLRNDPGGASWLAARLETPVLFLAEPTPDILRGMEGQGAYSWLPRGLALAHPELLHTSLLQLARQSELQHHLWQAGAALTECRQRVDRLVTRLWECSPTDGKLSWLSQRYMLERLQEEVSRVQRHGGPLTIALGELEKCVGQLEGEEVQQVALWSADRIARAKRRCDVSGQWGPTSFMLLLPRTSNAGAAGACQRLGGILEQGPSPLPGPHARLAARFGVATFVPDTDTPQALLSRAEESLERARSEWAGVEK